MTLSEALREVSTQPTTCYLDTADRTVALCTDDSTELRPEYQVRIFHRANGKIGKYIKTIKRRTPMGMINALKREYIPIDTRTWL